MLGFSSIADHAIATIPQASTPSGNYTVTADTGSYTLTGQAAIIRKTRIVVAAVGSYAVTGQSANLLRGKRIVANNGTYSVTGQSANILKSKRIVSNVGAYALTGVAANILKSRIVISAAGAYSVTGQNAGITRSRLVTADSGNYAVTGQDATITYSGGSVNYTLTAEAGEYLLTGVDAQIQYTPIQSGPPPQIYNLPGYRQTKRTDRELEDFYRSIGALPEIHTVTSVVSENSTQYAPIEENTAVDSTKRYIEAFERILDRISKDSAIARDNLAKQQKERIKQEIEEADIAYVASILAMSD